MNETMCSKEFIEDMCSDITSDHNDFKNVTRNAPEAFTESTIPKII